MALPIFNSCFRKRYSTKRRSHISGFTLLELLVAMIVSGFVVSGLLYIVVELLKVDRRESAIDQTQRDMQRALNYVSDDIREAVYVYEDPSVVADQLSDAPSSSIPILAFWRPDPIENVPDCSTSPISTSTVLELECQALEVRQAAYSLVIYFQKQHEANDNWSGQSRIIRYELDKYSNLTSLTQTTGYNDPAALGFDFLTWSPSGSTTDGTSAVLVDFVDNPDEPFDEPPLNDACASVGTGYQIIPSTATTTSNTSFFGCVRDDNPSSGVDGSSNQDIYLFIRGNTDEVRNTAIGSYLSSTTDTRSDSVLPILETRVLMRGVLNKNPVN